MLLSSRCRVVCEPRANLRLRGKQGRDMGRPHHRRRSDMYAAVGGLLVLGPGMLAVRDGIGVRGSRRTPSGPSTTCPRRSIQCSGRSSSSASSSSGRSSPSSPCWPAGPDSPSPPSPPRSPSSGSNGSSSPRSSRERPRHLGGRRSTPAAMCPLSGESFVSGHAVLVAALACAHRPVPPWPLEAAPVGRRGPGDVRPGLRRRPQPSRRHLRRRPRHRHRLGPQPRRRRPGRGRTPMIRAHAPDDRRRRDVELREVVIPPGAPGGRPPAR